MLRCAGGEAQRGECAVSAASALVLMSSTTTSSQHVGFAQGLRRGTLAREIPLFCLLIYKISG